MKLLIAGLIRVIIAVTAAIRINRTNETVQNILNAGAPQPANPVISPDYRTRTG